MSLSATTPEGTGSYSPGWLLHGRSPLWLIGVSALCGIGLAASGMMLMRAIDGAGVKDVLAAISRPATGRATRPAALAAAAPAASAPSAARDVAETAAPPAPASTPSASPASDVQRSADNEPSQTAAINRPQPASAPVVAMGPAVGAAPAAPAPAAAVANAGERTAPQPAGKPQAEAVEAGRIVKRSALDPIKPLRTRKVATPRGDEPRTREEAPAAAAPAGWRAIAAPVGSGTNVRAYTVGQDAPSRPTGASGASGGARIVRIEVPASR